MPLLTKSSKQGILSQTNSITSKHFKTPLKHKDKIRDIIEDTLTNSIQEREYDSFISKLSEGKHENVSSSPRANKTTKNLKRKLSLRTDVSSTQKENKDEAKTARVEPKNKSLAKKEKKEKKLKRKLSLSTDGSFSQEELNRNGTKAAYIEFMNKSLAKDAKKHTRIKDLSVSTDGSLSQEVLNRDEIKTAYVEFMNKSLSKEKKKKQSIIIYSGSSEDLFDDIVSQNICTLKPNEKVSAKEIESPQKLVSNSFEDSSNKSRGQNDNETFKSNLKGQVSTSKIKRNLMLANKSVKKNKKPEEMIKEKLSTKDKFLNKKAKKIHKNKVIDEFTRSKFKETIESDFPGLTPEEKMEALYEARNVGLYVYCDSCNKARYLPDVVDPLDVPDKWYCYMNPDKNHNKCSDPEHVEENEDFLVHNLYNAGSIVFAKMPGYPWWPAMVEDDPDIEEYFWLEDSMTPTYYHLTFFDSVEVSRAWIRVGKIKPFQKNLGKPEFRLPVKSKFRSRLCAAYKQGSDAVGMSLIDRLRTYGFLKRFKNKKHSKSSKGNSSQLTEKNEKKSERNEKQNLTSSLNDDNLSDILGEVSLQDLSFNFLD